MNSKSKEAFERIKQCCESACLGLGQSPYNRFLQSITPCREDLEVLQQDLERLEQLERRFDEFKLDYIVVEKYARKYKSLISGKLWRDEKTRTKWFNTIRSQKNWIDYLSNLRECQSSDEEQLLRIVNHLDTQVLYWALLSLEKEIKRYSEEKFEDE